MKVIAIDFDGTIAELVDYPEIGALKPFAKETINLIVDSGNEVIIWTCREVEEIKTYLLQQEIKYTCINENTKSLKRKWGNDPRKVGAHWFIDDKNLFNEEIDWENIRKELVRLNVIKK